MQTLIDQWVARAIYPAGCQCCAVIPIKGPEVNHWIRAIKQERKFAASFQQLKTDADYRLVAIGSTAVGNSIIRYCVLAAQGQQPGKINAHAFLIICKTGHEGCSENLTKGILQEAIPNKFQLDFSELFS